METGISMWWIFMDMGVSGSRAALFVSNHLAFLIR